MLNFTVRYRENNPQGKRWVSDKALSHLLSNGWSQDYWFTKTFTGEDEYQVLKIARKEWEEITGVDSWRGFCECCGGFAHNFEIDED